MAKGSGGNQGEFAGTEPNGSEPLEPSSLIGAGAGADDFDPSIHVGRDKRNADGTYTRKRGRKAGGKSSAKKAASSSDLKSAVETLSRTLCIVHTGIAAATSTPEMVIDKEEGDLLANAAANVMAEFDIRPDPKTEAIIGMIMACATVYGPRVVMVRARKAQEAKEKESGTAGIYTAEGEPAGTTEYNAAVN